MPRTPLFSVLQRSLRLAHSAQSRGIPLDEAPELARALAASHALTRRDFVIGSAAAASLAAIGCAPRRTSGALPAVRAGVDPVLIVGAGIAGLTAAYRLRQRGVPVRIVEAQQRVGGRMFSMRGGFPDGQVIELGGELIDTPHQHIRALAAELDIALDDFSVDTPGIDTEVWHFGGARQTHADVIAALAPVAARLAADRRAWPATFEPTYRNPLGVEALDRMTIAEWLDRAGVSGWARELIDVAFTTEYGMPLDRQSALNMLALIELEGDTFHVYGESDERFHVHHGNDAIPLALGDRLTGAVETATMLEAVQQRADGRFECTVRRDGGSRPIAATHVVIAIPFTLLRDVRLDVPLPEPKRRAIRELGYGANAKLMVGFNERVWRTRHRSNGSVTTSLPFQLAWEASRGQPGSSGILTNFTGGAHALDIGRGTAEEHGERLASDIDQIFPGARAAHSGMRAVRFHWPSFPWTRGSYAGYLPGQWTSIRGAEGESVGGLHFAGEHTSLAAQGFMEGGCESGERVAHEILSRLGLASGDARAPRRLLVGA